MLFGDALADPAAHWGCILCSLALAAAYGLLTAGAFALWPLARAAQVPRGRAVPRRAAAYASCASRPGAAAHPTPGQSRACWMALTVAASPERGLRIAWFCGGAHGHPAAVPCWAAARSPGLRARHAPRLCGSPWARLGVANLLPARRSHVAHAGLARPRLVHAGRCRADPGQHPCNQVLEQLPANGAQLLLHRHPERPARPVSADPRTPSPASAEVDEVPSLRAPHRRAWMGVPADQVQCHARHAMGAAR